MKASRAPIRIAQATALLGAIHALPAATALGPLRRRVTPRLAGQGDPSHIALTFDDGPDPASTPAFLEALDSLGWKATFFMLGSMAEACPSLAAEVAAAGHDVALHGSAHRNHLRATPPWVHSDLAKGLDQVSVASGRRPEWFRPPYGVLSAATVRAADKASLRTVLWGSWGRDWRRRASPSSVLADLSKTLRGGSTVLLHDSDCTSAPQSWRSALGALEGLGELAHSLGLTVGPLSDHGLV